MASIMRDWQRAKIDSCLLQISKDLDIQDTILKLKVHNLINANDEQVIMDDAVHQTDSEKCKKLVDIVKTRSERAYWAFCHAAQSKTPFIYNLLHKTNDDSESVEDLCSYCNGKENQLFNYCTGLTSVLSSTNFDKPKDILEAFQRNQIQIECLKDEVKLHKSDTNKLNVKKQELDYTIMELTLKVEMKEKELTNKENRILSILLKNQGAEIEKKQLNMTNTKLTEKIERLKAEINGHKKHLKKTEEDSLYSNSDAIAKARLEDHEHIVDEKDAAHSKLKYETLENLFAKQKSEHDQVFTELKDKLQLSEINLKQKTEEWKHQLDDANKEKEEIIKEKKHILKTLYEKDKLLKETKKSLMATGDDGISLENKGGNYSLQETNEKIKRLEEENERLRNQHVFCRQTDTFVTLKKIQNIFGIKFGMRKGVVLLGESRIFISSIVSEHISTIRGGDTVQTGDYVMYINNENVQDGDMTAVKTIISRNNGNLNLVLRTPPNKVASLLQLKLNHLDCEKYQDLGMQLAITVTVKNNSVACLSGLQDMDELVKINRYSADSYSINDITSKITKAVKQRQCDLTVQRYKWHTKEDLSMRHLSGLDSLPPSGLLRSTTMPVEGKYVRVGAEDASDSSESPPIVKNRPPMLLPRIPDSRSPPPFDSKTHAAFSENYGNYQRVVTCEYDEHGILVNKDSTENPSAYNTIQYSTKVVELKKEDYEPFGFHMIGGNKTGIFVEAIDTWKPAQTCGMQVGWKVLQINGFSMDKVAFCYANEVLQKFSADTKITFKFAITSMEYYKKLMRKRPYDSFHVKALVDYTARSPSELSFSAGDILCVTDSYTIDDPNQPYKWQAVKDEDTLKISGFIPRQISNRSPSAIIEHTYEEIEPSPEDSPSENRKSSLFPILRKKDVRTKERYYKILDPVGEVLV